jgi:hypothetical protein
MAPEAPWLTWVMGRKRPVVGLARRPLTQRLLACENVRPAWCGCGIARWDQSMDLDGILSFESAVIAACIALGLPFGVVVLVQLAFLAGGWYSGVVGTVKLTRRAGQALGAAVQNLRRMRWVRVLGALAAAVLVPCAQGLLLLFCYIVGNCLSIGLTLDSGRYAQIGEEIERHGFGFLSPGVWLPLLRTDWFSGPYLLVGVVCVLGSYRQALRGRSPDAFGKFLGLPAYLLGWGGIFIGGLGLAITAVIGLLSLLFDQPMDWMVEGEVIIPWVIVFAFSVVYWAACLAGVRSSSILVDVLFRSPHAGRQTDYGFYLDEYLFWTGA